MSYWSITKTLLVFSLGLIINNHHGGPTFLCFYSWAASENLSLHTGVQSTTDHFSYGDVKDLRPPQLGQQQQPRGQQRSR
jgi:hypothetical protein